MALSSMGAANEGSDESNRIVAHMQTPRLPTNILLPLILYFLPSVIDSAIRNSLFITPLPLLLQESIAYSFSFVSPYSLLCFESISVIGLWRSSHRSWSFQHPGFPFARWTRWSFAHSTRLALRQRAYLFQREDGWR
jgi:hypothetical protein